MVIALAIDDQLSIRFVAMRGCPGGENALTERLAGDFKGMPGNFRGRTGPVLYLFGQNNIS
jgi:hypothetical protein